MSDVNFSLIFKGVAVDNGEIDVQDLAPALLSVGQLIQESNNVINGEKAKASVYVKATSKGSFEVDLTIVQSLLDATKMFLDFADDNNGKISAANDLLDLIFKFTAGGGVIGGGVIALLKWLKGRKPDRIEASGNDVHVHIGDTYFVTNNKVIEITESIAVREQAKKLVSVLKNREIENISSKVAGSENINLTHDDIPSFDFSDEIEEDLHDETRRINLQIISLSFKEENKWRFTDGLEPFTASIEDTIFLNKIANNEISFSKNDYLTCDVRERQIQTSKGLKMERTILKVISHKPSARQLKLI